MFPRLIRSSNREAYQFALMFGRDKWYYAALALLFLAGGITTFFDVDGQSLLLPGLLIMLAAFVLPMFLLFLARPVVPWASVTSLLVKEDGTMEVSLRLFHKPLAKKKTMRLTYCAKRKEGYYLGTSYARSVYLPFGSFGHEDAEFLASLEGMIKNRAYPLR